jgi:plastocyanin
LTKSLKSVALFAVLVVAALSVAVPALAASSAKVSIYDSLFLPNKLTVKQGTKVTWKWQATSYLPHNVTVTSGPVKFHSPTQDHGSFSKVMTKPGIYKISSTVDDGMKMTLIVKAH